MRCNSADKEYSRPFLIREKVEVRYDHRMYYIILYYYDMYIYYVYVLCIMKENNESLEIISNGKNYFVLQGFTYSAK